MGFPRDPTGLCPLWEVLAAVWGWEDSTARVEAGIALEVSAGQHPSYGKRRARLISPEAADCEVRVEDTFACLHSIGAAGRTGMTREAMGDTYRLGWYRLVDAGRFAEWVGDMRRAYILASSATNGDD